MKILLIKPKWFVDGDAYKYKDLYRTPPLNLGIIAALSEGHEVKIIDEDVEEIKYSEDWDLVGITSVVFTSLRAYEISEKFRKLGVKTVLGGPHSSLMPEEGLKYADSVVVGEAEPVWKDILYDCEKGNLRRIYGGNGKVADMNKVPFPRRDLMPEEKYFTTAVQATRGCSNICEYCYLQSVPWKKYRKRDVDLVYEEIKQIKHRHIFPIDDNLFVDFDYAKKLFDKIAPLKKYWGVQAPTTIAEDEELLEKMKNAGCWSVAFGFQSVSQDALNLSKVRNRVDKYKRITEKLFKYKIMVDGFFMFGFDTDDETIFKATLKMIKELDLDDAILYILTPYPGTKLFKRFDREGRILNYDWSKYSWYNCVFKPAKMKPEELEDGLHWIYQELNKHFKRTFPRRVWKYKELVFKYLPMTIKVINNYWNWVDVTKLP